MSERKEKEPWKIFNGTFLLACIFRTIAATGGDVEKAIDQTLQKKHRTGISCTAQLTIILT